VVDFPEITAFLFPVCSMHRQYWGQHLWARGYFVVTTDTVTYEIIKEYIVNQDIGIHDDDFQIGN